MDLDEDLCLCFHVTRRKVINFLRVEKPTRLAQLAECQGAGTGCGWCRPFLKKLFDQAQAAGPSAPATLDEVDLPPAPEYAQQRDAYRA